MLPPPMKAMLGWVHAGSVASQLGKPAVRTPYTARLRVRPPGRVARRLRIRQIDPICRPMNPPSAAPRPVLRRHRGRLPPDRARALARRAGAAGLLGALVRPLPQPQADARKAGARLRRPLRAGQAQHRRGAADLGRAADPQHSAGGAVRRRPAGGPVHGRAARRPGARLPRQAHRRAGVRGRRAARRGRRSRPTRRGREPCCSEALRWSPATPRCCSTWPTRWIERDAFDDADRRWLEAARRAGATTATRRCSSASSWRSNRPEGDPQALAARIAANAKDFEARFALAALQAYDGDFNAAFDQLLEVVLRDKAEWREKARAAAGRMVRGLPRRRRGQPRSALPGHVPELSARRARRRSRCRCAPCVAPSATAASRSALMPIDSVSSARPPSFSAASSSRSARCGARCASKSVGRLGNGHQPAQPHPLGGSAATACATAATSSGSSPLLLASPLMLTCRHSCSGGSAGGPLLGQALRDLQPVDAVHPVEVLGHDARLVALQRADQVPAQTARAGRPARRSWPAPPARSSRRSRAGRRHGPRAPVLRRRSCSLPTT